METIQEHLRQLAERICEQAGIELVDVAVKGRGVNRILQCTVDKDGGITVDDCAELNRNLVDFLEGDSLWDDGCRVEVSSPGLDRPLRTEKDFMKNIGRDILACYLTGDEKKELSGTVLGTENGRIFLKSGHETVSIPIAAMIKAKIKLKW